MIRALVVATVLLTACSDDVDLTGVYRVDADLSSAPCGMDTQVMDAPVAIKFTKDTLFGDYFSYQSCTDLAGTMCSGGGLFSDTFSEPVDGGWRGIVTSSSSGGSADPTCTISYSEGTATLHGKLLIIDVSGYSAKVDNTPALCSTDEAERRNKSMACTEHRRIEGTKQ